MQELADSVKPKYKLYNYIFGFSFITGLVLLIFEIHLYRETIIIWSIPSAVWIFSGLIITPFTSSILQKYLNVYSFIFKALINIIAFGGMVTYLFMASNYYFSDSSQVIVKKVNILNTGYLAEGRYGCSNPYADVKIDNTPKELIFPCDITIEKYKFIKLSVKKGLLGFDIIIGKEPEE